MIRHHRRHRLHIVDQRGRRVRLILDQTVIRDWSEQDINASDAADGITAEDKQFAFGIGPACGGSVL